MSGDIVVSGGSTEVVSDALLGAHDSLVSISRLLDELAHELRPAVSVGSGLLTHPEATALPAQHGARLASEAATGIRDAASLARRLASDLAEAAAGYDEADSSADAGVAGLSTFAGWVFGRFAPFVAAAALPGLLAALGVAFEFGSIAAGSPRAYLSRLGAAVGSKASVLRNPRVVSLIRLMVSSADDAMLGAVGLPLSVTSAMGDRGGGQFGLRGATTIVLGGGNAAGLLRETPVHVDRISAAPVASPTSYAELASRVPESQSGSPQVRVERYRSGSGDPAYLVYVGGTVDTSPVAGGEPFDITSDLVGVAQLDAGSVRATQMAMQQAGIQPGDTVIPVGYSQGGIVATSIAVSGDYDVPALITFGSPTAGIDVPSSTVDVAVEHTDDLVPALGGIPLAGDRGGGDRILVTRQTYSGSVPAGSSPIDAHLLSEYTATAGAMDAAHDPRLNAALAELPHGQGDVGLYRGVRVHLPPQTSGGRAW